MFPMTMISTAVCLICSHQAIPKHRCELIQLPLGRFSDDHQWKSLNFTGLQSLPQDLLHWGMLLGLFVHSDARK